MSPEYYPSGGTDHLRDYLNEIGRRPLLTGEEEIILGTQVQAGIAAQNRIAEYEEANKPIPNLEELEEVIQEGKEAANQMFMANQRLVVSIAKKYRNNDLDLMDRIQEGSLGLMRAVEKFDPQKGFKFSTYATWWIRQGITRAISDKGNPIRIPVHQLEKIRKLNSIEARMLASHEHVDDKAIMKEMGIDEDQLISLREANDLLTLSSLDAPIGADDDSVSLSDFISSGYDVTDDVMAKSQHEEIMSIIAKAIPEPRNREILVTRLRGEKTLEEIGHEYGITRERVRQIEQVGLAHLREQLILNEYIDIDSLLGEERAAKLKRDENGKLTFDARHIILDALRAQDKQPRRERPFRGRNSSSAEQPTIQVGSQRISDADLMEIIRRSTEKNRKKEK